MRPPPRVEIWPRGGAKSSTAEVGVVWVGVKGTRRFALYVSGTQDQADQHVQNIADLFEQVGVERAVGKYGTSRGWRRNQLRTSGGFNVAAIGLDVAARGIKLGQYRPDLIIFDDVDALHDTPRTVQKKIEAIKKSIIPAGSADCAILGIQNLIHEDSVFSMLSDGRADFLLDRAPAIVEPAVKGLVFEEYRTPEGVNRYRVTGGDPTWAGQDLALCERQINDWGLRSFLEEAQHEVASAAGWFFNADRLQVIDSLPENLAGWKFCRGWDFAATHGGGDWTVGLLLARAPFGLWVVVDVVRGQWSADEWRDILKATTARDFEQYGTKKPRLPQDPGQAGKDQAAQLKGLLAGFEPVVKPVSGAKPVRWRGLADAVNDGNVAMLRAPWNDDLRRELRKIREDEEHAHDDQADAGADAFNELNEHRPVMSVA